MLQNQKCIQLDLNNPVFLESWFQLQNIEAERVRSAFQKIHQLSWDSFYKLSGFKWEKIESLPAPLGVDCLYTFRVTKSVRCVAYRDGNFMRIMYVQPDHDAAYGKK